MQSLSAPLIENHAGHVLADELFSLLDALGLRYRVPTPAASGGLPAPGEAEWLPALQEEAVRLTSACNAATILPDLQASAIQRRYNDLKSQFTAPTFLTSGDYLIDMGGHELMAALRRHLNGIGAPGNFTQELLADELLRILRGIYQPNSIYQPDDFAELATILK
jgi:hypothetical protein